MKALRVYNFMYNDVFRVMYGDEKANFTAKFRNY